MVILMVAVAAVYALPSAYSKSPVVQVRAASGGEAVDAATMEAIRKALQQSQLSAKSLVLGDGVVQAVFANSDSQVAARAVIAEALGSDYVAAYNTATTAPRWLRSLGAKPLALGLDLRGGVYFLLQVDVDFALAKRLQGIGGEIEISFAGVGGAPRKRHVGGRTGRRNCYPRR